MPEDLGMLNELSLNLPGLAWLREQRTLLRECYSEWCGLDREVWMDLEIFTLLGVADSECVGLVQHRGGTQIWLKGVSHGLASGAFF